jgi:lipoprotein
MKKLLGLMMLLTVLILSGCSSGEVTKDTNLIEVYQYNTTDSDLYRLELPIEKQRLIMDELNKLQKSEDRYGLKSAYNDTSYKIVVPEKYEIQIIEDKPYYEDNLFWYQVTSEDEATEGVYKSTENLKEKIAAIIAKGSV